MSAGIRWRLTKPVSRPVPASDTRADPDRDRARVLSAIALASVAAGAVNVAAAATVGRGSTQNLAFFSVVAAAGRVLAQGHGSFFAAAPLRSPAGTPRQRVRIPGPALLAVRHPEPAHGTARALRCPAGHPRRQA